MLSALSFFLIFPGILSIGIGDVVIVILSQGDEYYSSLAENSKTDIQKQAELLSKETPVVHIAHKDFPHIGAWTIIPLILPLYNLHRNNCSWALFAEDRTKIRLNLLLQALNKYDHHQSIWLSYSLFDEEPTIIHHFANFENPKAFKYPSIASGVAISCEMLQRLSRRIEQGGLETTDFYIDSAFQLAEFIWNDGKGARLIHEPTFCIANDPQCATYPQPYPTCGKPIPLNSIYFAVKTCEKFHKSRLKIVNDTWAKYTSIIRYFSDVEDATIPTISLGVPNTERGHCEKTIRILRYVHEELKTMDKIKWLVIADDDTIVSVSRLGELLSCYDPSIPLAIGERYGYNIYQSYGFNYITAGGGIVLSKPLLEQLVKTCQCPDISSPDDIYLGYAIAKLGFNITHSPLFHQARPNDYSSDLLKTQRPVSFHKHWMIDPLEVYKEWFEEEDRKLIGSTASHQEL